MSVESWVPHFEKHFWVGGYIKEICDTNERFINRIGNLWSYKSLIQWMKLNFEF